MTKVANLTHQSQGVDPALYSLESERQSFQECISALLVVQSYFLGRASGAKRTGKDYVTMTISQVEHTASHLLDLVARLQLSYERQAAANKQLIFQNRLLEAELSRDYEKYCEAKAEGENNKQETA